ncbi:MAG: formate dehydrogenase subunit alpha [Hyphomicrobiales bacterium]|nr:formate dehydrogenase subunit alpha [Hyphomicrobiales bacterium]
MSDVIRFSLDGMAIEAQAEETIWQAAQRHGVAIPHLCHRPEAGYQADGNCRACMVEIEGERTLAASCIRKPKPGITVRVGSERATKARRMVMELLLADQPPRADAHDPNSRFWRWAEHQGVTTSRFPATPRIVDAVDRTHPAMAVHLDACIHCNLCVRACRDVQVNDVIGMAYRGHLSKIVFDMDATMADSTCVACGECVQACPTGALMPATRVDAEGRATDPTDREVDSVCPYCGVGCQLTYEIAQDRIVSVKGREGPANLGRLCVKGRFGFDYQSHPERLAMPLIRKEGAPKDGAVDPANPLSQFREASWDEALDRAAGGFARIRGMHGGKALAGFGSAKGSNEEAYLFQKLVRTGFGVNNVDHCTRLCHASSVAALLEGVGSGAVSAPFMAAADAEVIVVIGANPTENHPVAATFFKQATRRGAKLIVMDPRGLALRRQATHMLQFRPGRDVAMLNALIHVIIEEDLYDRRFVAERTKDFEALADGVRDFSPEAMADICGIPPSTLREVARRYAQSKASISFRGMGVSQHVHGTDNARCLIALALLTGQIGRPGTGLHPLRGQNNVQGASDAGLIPMFLPDYQPVEDEEARLACESLWGASISPKRGLTVVEIMEAARGGSIRGLYVMGENPAMSDPDATHAREALASLEHLVVQDIFLTETAAYADVILPASAWPEKDGTVTNTNRQVQLGRKALLPPGQARPDFDIIVDMARRLGLDWRYAHPRDAFAEMARIMPSLANISWERLEREGSVTYPCADPDIPGEEIVFRDAFPTSDGRGRFVPAELVAPDEEPDTDYPFVLTTGRQLEHWHTGSMTRRTRVLDMLEPAAMAYLSPADLTAAGLKPGDRLRVSTRRGTIELNARADDAIPQGLIFIPFAYAEAAANLLTNPKLDPYGKIPEFKYCAARMDAIE